MPSDDEQVLHVVWSPFDNVAHIVSAATIAAAAAADAAPIMVDFGDLRRSGDADELRQRLEEHDYGSLESYVTAIEEQAGLAPSSADIAERLAAVNAVEFSGRPWVDSESADVTALPADSDLFRNEAEQEAEPDPEFRGYSIIATAMSADIPADLFKKYATARFGDSPVYSGHIDDSVSSEQLPALVAELKARGYIVVED